MPRRRSGYGDSSQILAGAGIARGQYRITATMKGQSQSQISRIGKQETGNRDLGTGNRDYYLIDSFDFTLQLLQRIDSAKIPLL